MGLFSSNKSKSSSSTYSSAPPPYTPNPNMQQQQYAPPSPPGQGNPDTRNLPSGWITQFDPSSNRWFYVYTPTATRQWEHPLDRPLNSSDSYRSSQQQQPYYAQPQQPYYPQQQPYYVQPQQQQQGRFGGLFGGSGNSGRMGGMGR
ncbi:uncharacterized protein BX664DRAFT_322260 [Halteromyces radiatus]|uniref:uncharacterized protein n=1 Tax=Halteromyces radiatus TaxID=101107 RepID=UPI00221FD710|nr:uncharacterized protein BX664DRAFT_322260 [Halteromyces radiatus]KAI8099850.1 hypothetical protein BX664DRAFT_322260 [Halteromyces radiatus]